MQEPKPMNFGCVILCPDRQPRSLTVTMRSLRNFTDCLCIAIVPKGTSQTIVESMKPLCLTYRGGTTYTSLINQGVGKVKKNDWAIVLFAGTVVRPNFWKKYSVFVEDEKDILFPITAGHTDFVTGSLNGLTMHINAIKLVGKMPEISDINEAKTAWAYNAIAAGYRLKGILGTRFIT